MTRNQIESTLADVSARCRKLEAENRHLDKRLSRLEHERGRNAPRNASHFDHTGTADTGDGDD